MVHEQAEQKLKEVEGWMGGLVPDMFPDIFPTLGNKQSGDPKINEDADHYHKFSGEAFLPDVAGGSGEKIKLNDIDQGNLGDCYFLAALGAVALANPRWISDKMVKINTNEAGEEVSYTITFYTSWGNKEAETVDSNLPVNEHGNLVYAGNSGGIDKDASGKIELWPMIIEKAYAAWKGSYEDIVSGKGSTALEHITGKDTDRYTPFWYDAEGWAKLAKEKLDAKKCPLIATPGSVKKTLQNIAGVEVTTDHVYVVEKVTVNSGTYSIDLYNPHGPHKRLKNLTAEQFEAISESLDCLESGI